MNVVNLLIKPASSGCNMMCHYCFYHDLSKHRLIPSYQMMQRDTLEMVVKEAFKTALQAVVFAFQGGEPTLVGLDFYHQLIQLVNRYNSLGLPVSYSIQTNGLRIDEAWCHFFKTHQFLVGISLDGDEAIHDQYRQTQQHQPTFNQVMAAIDLLKTYEVDYNILTVITQSSSSKAKTIYEFFKQNGFHYLQFIPCLPPWGQKTSSWAVTPQQYDIFLNDLFLLWYEDITKGIPISIRYFDNLIGMILGFLPQACDLSGSCSSNLIVESNGDIYPCDFYVLDDYRLGNINQTALHDIINSPKAQQFLITSSQVHDKCKSCDIYQLCRGGCRRHKEIGQIGTLDINYFCETYDHFIHQNIHLLESIALQWMKQNQSNEN